jgi:glutaredoxin
VSSRGSVDQTRGAKTSVEILSFVGCPHREPAIELVEQVARELQLEPDVRVVDVEDHHIAERLQFLGSPTIRVQGRDIEPGADDRREYALTCRLYRTEQGACALPDPRWLRDALVSIAG